jgi:hypothetical protein
MLRHDRQLMLRSWFSILVASFAGASIAWFIGVDGPFKAAMIVLGFGLGVWIQSDDRPETFNWLARLAPAWMLRNPGAAGAIAGAAVVLMAPGWRPVEAAAVALAVFAATWTLVSAAKAQTGAPLGAS